MHTKVLVIGLGVSGQAAAALLLEKGFSVTAVDRRFEQLKQEPRIASFLAKGMELYSDQARFASGAFASIILSPGISRSHPLVDEATNVMSEVELGLTYLLNHCVLAVTGTNGKTTTVSLTAHALSSSGKKAVALGNIGSPLCDYVLRADREEIVVLELSSFQLQTLSKGPYFHAALILNITPNHLNWHASMQEYAAAKLHLQNCLKSDGKLFVSQKIRDEYLVGEVFPEGGSAWALCSFCKMAPEQFQIACQSFQKLPHRMEWVDEIDGVAYYNDSKATNVAAVIHAISLLEGPIVLIAGGVDKGSPYTPWIAAFHGKVQKIIVYGEAAQKIEEELKPHFPVKKAAHLQEAFQAAIMHATSPCSVLLSPGCSSYDQFKGFAERGDLFKKMVKDLRNGA